MSFPNTIKELKARISKGLNFGIEAIEEVLSETSPFQNELILYKSKYNDLMNYSALNVLPYVELELGFDKLRNSLLMLIDKLTADDLDKEEVEQELTNKAIPYRRTNFFELIEIHYRNLEDIVYATTQQVAHDQYELESFNGRNAVFRHYEDFKWNYRDQLKRKMPVDIKKHAKDFFLKEQGFYEVYFKNIKHIISYILEVEIDQPFFINTLSSLFSRFELAVLFYFLLADMDEELTTLVRRVKLLSPTISPTLVDPEDWNLLDV